MGYHLYCYKSKLGWPDLKEARQVIEMKEADNTIVPDPATKLKIAGALISYNPRLEGEGFEYDELAKLLGTTIEEAREQFDHMELNTPEGDLNTQITIFDNIVSFEVPYLYRGAEADEVFANIDRYTKIIAHAAGYFVYDPQTGHVYDPSSTDFEGVQVYKRQAGEKVEVRVPVTANKRWWKIWKPGKKGN
jgi:hypothetical protein